MKKSLVWVLIVCIIMTTGCSMGVDLDSKENDLIAEYAAGVVLLHSHYYDDRYDKPWMYPDDTEEPTTETPTTEEPTIETPTTEVPSTENPTSESQSQENETVDKPSEESTGGNNPSSGGNEPVEKPTEEPEELNLTEVFGTHPVEVKYTDYSVYDSYDVDPDGYFYILPDKNCSFLVLNFTLCNRSFVEQTVNTEDEKVIIRLTINGTEKFNNYDASMLSNDLTVLKDVSLESKEEYTGVILYMIPTELTENIESMYIEVASDFENKSQLVLQ